MTNIKENIINTLLDKYERSTAFKSGKASTRRIILKLYYNGTTDFSAYDIEDHEKRIAVNQSVLDLKASGFIDFQWLKGETDHIISEVWLVFDRIDETYRFAKRMPKSDILDEMSLELQELLNSIQLEWARRFLNDALESIKANKKIPSIVPSDEAERKNLFKAIRFINDMASIELTQRVFSMKCFGDSKQFERAVKPKLMTVLRKYEDWTIDATDEDVLRQVGIIKYPEQFDFCGNIQICINDEFVDFSPLAFGSSIFISDIRRDITIKAKNILRIITIENRANYFSYIRTDKRKDELVIYHGGHYSPARKSFFKEIKKAMTEGSSWLHWGDIDYGGFSMLHRLRKEISNEIRPFRMSIDELCRFNEYTSTIEETYIDKLKTLLHKQELSDCHDCIRYMIDNKLRLEQEAMLTE